ncbi:MAG: glycosyltransferase family 39 protein [Xanthobacteraceae bacterium]
MAAKSPYKPQPMPQTASAPSPAFPSAFATRIARHPIGAFAAFAALHIAVWTALPTALYRNLPLDLIEALVYGREWQLGYDKLPPLPWWLAETAYRLFGHDVAYYALAQLTVIAAFAAVWATARPLVGPLGALLAVLIADGLHYFNYTAPKFNHDVVQLPFWALAGYAYHRALRGKALWPWLVLGAAIGGAVWAKYFVAVLALPLGLFLLVDGEARKALRTLGPYLALLAALVVMAPHLVWLVQNDFLPFAYAEARAAPSRGFIDHLWHPLQFVLEQLGFLVPALLIAAPLLWPPARGESAPGAADAYDRRIVTVLAFGPLATVLALSALSGRGTVAMWGYPLFLFLGLAIALAARAGFSPTRVARVLVVWALAFTAFAVAFVVNYAVLPSYDGRYRAVLYPGGPLAAEMSRRFRAATGEPLAYVISSMWDGGNVAHYAREQPRVLIDGSPRRAPWIDLADLNRRGALVLWTEGDGNTLPAAYRAVAAGAQVQPPFSLPFLLGPRKLDVGWAILPPQAR